MSAVAYVTPGEKIIIDHIVKRGRAPYAKYKSKYDHAVRNLMDKGVISRVSRGKYETTGKPFIVTIKRKSKRKNANYKVDLSQYQINYILANYMLYRRKRGELARQVGLTRLDLNFAIMDLGLCGGEDECTG